MKKIVLVGVGELFYRVYPWIKKPFFDIIDIWDNDKKKNGKNVDEYLICAPSDKYVSKDIEFIITSTYVEEIKKQLIQIGYDTAYIHDIWWAYSCRMKSFYKRNDFSYGRGEKEAIEHIRKHGLTTYNTDLSMDYRESEVECGFDKYNNRYFCMHSGKRMYMKECYGRAEAVSYYNKLRKEQDINSPHCYGKFVKNERYDYVVDAGCAEGIFSLDLINKCDEMFLLEPDEAWFKTCKCTFGCERNNTMIHMLSKKLGNKVAEDSITLDYLFEKHINNKNLKILIKMDIEGAEEDALTGASKLLSSDNEITVIACGYHHANACDQIESILRTYDFNIDYSERNMFFRPEYEINTISRSEELNKNLDSNYRLRHGLVVGYKNSRGEK